jgi:hypothetical protein
MNANTGISDRMDALPADQVRADAGRVGVAAKTMGALTLLIGGPWWLLMWTYVMTHRGARGLDELLIPTTALLTCLVFIAPTMLLTRSARLRSSDKLRFNRFVLSLVGGLMTWTVIYGVFLYS